MRRSAASSGKPAVRAEPVRVSAHVVVRQPMRASKARPAVVPFGEAVDEHAMTDP